MDEEFKTKFFKLLDKYYTLKHPNELGIEPENKLMALMDSYSREAQIAELTKTKDYIEDTIMIITNDLQSLLHHEEVYQLRRYHKDEIQKNIDERIAELKALGGENE